MRRISLRVLVLTFGLLLSSLPPSVAALNAPGTKCAKAGTTAKSGSTSVKCVKSGNKLIWQKVAATKVNSTILKIIGTPANAAKNGTSCKKRGVLQETDSVWYKCQKSNGNLKWIVQSTVPQAPGVINFAVNGIDGLWSPSDTKKVNNRAGNTEWSNYLAIALAKGRGYGGLVSIPWTGDLNVCSDQNQASSKLLEWILKVHSVNPGIKINIVAHSQGTVIAYNALKSLEIINLALKQKEKDSIQINNFLSLGTLIPLSSLGGPECIETLLPFEKPKSVTKWVNVYRECDVLSRLVEIADENILLPPPVDSRGPIWCHAQYFENKELAKRVLECTGEAICSWIQSLSVEVTLNPSKGTVPLNDVSLTATVAGSARGTINYTFYCDRSDSGTNITSGWNAKFDGVSDNPKTATCTYPYSGTYTAKVIVERGTSQAEARATVKIDSLGTLDATIKVGTNPIGVAINPAGTFAYVANEGSDTVSRIDLATNSVDATIKVGLSPMSVAINPAGTFAYVANASSGTVSRINLATNTVDATITVGKGPVDVAIYPAGTFAYVANVNSNTVSRINLATNTVDATITVGKRPVDVAIDPAGTFAYVANWDSDTVSRINLATNRVDATIKVGDRLGGIAINPAGTFAYVTIESSDTVSRINLATNTVDVTIPVGSSTSWAVAINPAGTFAYVTTSNTVSRINLATNTVDAAIKVGDPPGGLAINPAGTFAYVVNFWSDTVSRIKLVP